VEILFHKGLKVGKGIQNLPHFHSNNQALWKICKNSFNKLEVNKKQTFRSFEILKDFSSFRILFILSQNSIMTLLVKFLKQKAKKSSKGRETKYIRFNFD
jgi:hypothetical protein